MQTLCKHNVPNDVSLISCLPGSIAQKLSEVIEKCLQK